MPGMITVNTAATFSTVLLMGSGPRTAYGSTDQDRTPDGLPKWDCQVAVTYLADPGQRPQSEVLSITVASPADPAAGIPPGSPVEFTDLREGVSTAEAKQDGRGVRGGRRYWSASGLRSSLPTGRPAVKAAE